MAIRITMGIQKGGCGKSTTTGVLAHLLARDGYKVLAVDLDSQGNLTELLSQTPANEFAERSVLEAMQEQDARPYIFSVDEKIDLLPANNFLATFQRWLYTGKTYLGDQVRFTGSPSLVLNNIMEQIDEDYDFVVMDTPPSLSEQTTNALCASDHVVVMYECSNWCYSAIPNFLDSVDVARDVSPNAVNIAGILRTMNDVRRNDAKAFNEIIEEDHPELVFETIITRKAPTGRLALYGFEENPEIKQALAQYEGFYKELIDRVQD
ncbi:ParA family protein [Salsuginibacillus kocurii]|uniref:ParA family protein n=1 Tax=Salsuginibacillus kocurii TaxID=427078 RepID=UPI0003726B46|nr:ParA family protein [Salsuginibacillus kocurii]